MPKRGGKRTKSRTHKDEAPVGATSLSGNLVREDVPRSIVAKGGKIAAPLKKLIIDLRKMMSPHTAMNLRERSYNKMKDFTEVAQQLGVSHVMTVSQTQNHNVVVKIAKSPNGPTLHFRANAYSLSANIKASQKKPFENQTVFMTPPLVVLNNFGQSDKEHLKLMKIMFQNMLPSINLKTVRLNDCKRVVLFHYKKDEDIVEMRHYAIKATPVGINRNIKKLVEGKIPNLGSLTDMSEYLEGSYGGANSDSEADDDDAKVELAENFNGGKGTIKSTQSAMKLIEIGPRMTLELFKVEAGVGEGDIIYHKFVQKSAEEAQAIKSRIESAKSLKTERRQIQDENVKRKADALVEKRKAKIERVEARKKARLEREEGNSNGDGGNDDNDDDDDDSNDDDDDDDDDDDEEDYEGDYDEDDDEDEEDDE